MRILINDHSGHNFTLNLSKQLAKKNNVVLHCFSINFPSPKGYLSKHDDDPNGLFLFPIAYNKEFKKYSLIGRSFQELEYARKLNNIIKKESPDIVICANTPLIAQLKILLFCNKTNTPFVYWCQDLYGIAIRNILTKKLGFCGRLFSLPFEFIEKYQLRKANAIVAITEDFKIRIRRWGIKTKTEVIQNWNSIDDIIIVPKENSFSKAWGIEKSFNIIYSGTLGLKHNPDLIIQLSRKLSNTPNVKITVISEGIGAEYLSKEKEKYGLENLILIPFQPFEDFSLVLSSANILLALLEKDAGTYSVPSKILSYLCAGKSIIIAAPYDNLASKIIRDSKSGRWVDCAGTGELLEAVIDIMNNEDVEKCYSENARRYAENNFNIEVIVQKFEGLIREVTI